MRLTRGRHWPSHRPVHARTRSSGHVELIARNNALATIATSQDLDSGLSRVGEVPDSGSVELTDEAHVPAPARTNTNPMKIAASIVDKVQGVRMVDNSGQGWAAGRCRACAASTSHRACLSSDPQAVFAVHRGACLWDKHAFGIRKPARWSPFTGGFRMNISTSPTWPRPVRGASLGDGAVAVRSARHSWGCL
jgi:hypothetical protein